jgi:hypothetical protein
MKIGIAVEVCLYVNFAIQGGNENKYDFHAGGV